MFERIRSELQCLEKQDQNSSVWKDKVTIPMFGTISVEFQCLERIESEFQCL